MTNRAEELAAKLFNYARDARTYAQGSGEYYNGLAAALAEAAMRISQKSELSVDDVSDPYGNGTLVPDDHWGRGCPHPNCDVHSTVTLDGKIVADLRRKADACEKGVERYPWAAEQYRKAANVIERLRRMLYEVATDTAYGLMPDVAANILRSLDNEIATEPATLSLGDESTQCSLHEELTRCIYAHPHTLDGLPCKTFAEGMREEARAVLDGRRSGSDLTSIIVYALRASDYMERLLDARK